ncbi:helix-turn-helix domain-containing protein [Mangrovivirga sp. M17]|uniref:Helix-turn-helix domain-containing protein n=1 Tax=Mangrovivirga halotolerans TaxID=2993936 RepID=A0ABT3RPV0_9BACT|nr:helix-turn-helix domain-containing protein [Mangrovivirga halotolerans]MCX2743287.1 helix-turn-helix domain-containing protein [Mangrovivirga halotolerans]
MSTGQLLSRLRKEKRITQEELAEISGISLRKIQQIEKDQTEPKHYILNQLVKALDCSSKKLVADSSKKYKREVELLKVMNLSALSLILFPYGNIIFQSIILFKNRNKIRFYSVGKKIFSFQVIWTLTTSIILLITSFWQIEINQMINLSPFPVILVVYCLAIVINCVVIISQQKKLKAGNIKVYNSIPDIF